MVLIMEMSVERIAEETMEHWMIYFPRVWKKADCETRFFRATGSQYREPLARGDQSRRRGAESHRSKHKYKEPPELRRRRLFVFNQLNVWKYCL